jgi:diaminopimelate epimerase
MRFVKMHGIGNDYVYVDAFACPIDDPAGLARAVSVRQTGVGSDGLILVAPPSRPGDADVRMRMFNADGSESEMCGNGVRCVTKFAIDRGLADANPLRVETGRGTLPIRWTVGPDGRVDAATVEMGEPILACGRIPAEIPGVAAEAEVIGWPMPRSFLANAGIADADWDAARLERRMTLVSMGNPHLVVFCPDVAGVPLADLGPALERHPWFPRRMNVHVVSRVGPDEFAMRTWERGSGITLACGTGASAVGVACVRLGLASGTRPMLVHLPGGDLRIDLGIERNGGTVRKTGPASEVFEGELSEEFLAANGIRVGVPGRAVRA